MYGILTLFALIYCGLASASNPDFNFHFNRTLYEPDRAANCTNRSADFTNATEAETCHAISNWKRNHSQEYCANFWFYNERVFFPNFRNSSERASVQYCNGTSDFIACVKCFNLATEPLWDIRRCTEYDRIKPVVECFKNYTNEAFNWSREVILNNANVTKLIHSEYPPYGKCQNHFRTKLNIRKNFTVKFPVSFPFYSEDDDSSMNVMLSFYLNAFENNNPNGTTINQTTYPDGFHCQDFQNEGYLQQYYDGIEERGEDIPEAVKSNYEKIRSDMCMNVTECISCFNRSDLEFFRRLRLSNYRINSLIAEFNKTSEMYHDCRQRYNISQNYVALLNNSHTGMAKVNVSNCTDDVKTTYNFLVNNPSYLNTNNGTKYKSFIDVTAINIYSAFGFAAKQNLTETCAVIEKSLMPCVFTYTKDLIENTRGNISRREEEEALNLFTQSTRFCVKHSYVDTDYDD